MLLLLFFPPLSGLQFENSCEIGVFSKLTNAYCLVAIGGSENFYRFVLCLVVWNMANFNLCLCYIKKNRFLVDEFSMVQHVRV